MSDLIAKNPQFETVVRDSFSRQPFMELIGARMSDLKPGFCEITLDRDTRLTQQHGFFHGGLVGSVVDSAAGYAAYSLYPENSTVLTVDMKVNFLRPADGDTLIARAQVIHPGGKLYHLKGEAFSVTEGEEKLCMTGVFTMMCLLGVADATSLGKDKGRAST